MDKKFGYYIFGGMLIGALFGMIWAGNGNPALGIATGALVGTAVGWVRRRSSTLPRSIGRANQMEPQSKKDNLSPGKLFWNSISRSGRPKKRIKKCMQRRETGESVIRE